MPVRCRTGRNQHCFAARQAGNLALKNAKFGWIDQVVGEVDRQ
jgi:hypothetical protein